MSKLLWFLVVLSALVMVEQTEGWRRRRRRRCYERSCVVGNWGWWGSCSKSCNRGVRTRSRTMERYATCGRSCPYALRETESCNRFSCPSKLKSSLIRTPLFISFNLENIVGSKHRGLPIMFTLLRQRRLRWLGHVHRMPDGRIPKDLLYGELATGSRRTGRPQLRYRDVVKRDMEAVDIDIETWENLAADRSQWRGAVTKHLKTGEDKLTQAALERRVRRKLCVSSVQQPACTCNTCNKDCHSRTGLHSHSRRCSSLAHN